MNPKRAKWKQLPLTAERPKLAAILSEVRAGLKALNNELIKIQKEVENGTVAEHRSKSS